MGGETFLALCAFALAASITPGPNNIMILASVTNFGVRRTLPHIIGVEAGFLTLLMLTGLGLAQLFELFPLSRRVLLVFCVAYLLYLAWKIATAVPAKPDGATGKPLSFWQAFAFQWINPKAWTMGISAMTVYAADRTFWAVALVTIVFGFAGLPSVGLWAFLGTLMRKLLENPQLLRTFNVTMALLLVASLYPLIAG